MPIIHGPCLLKIGSAFIYFKDGLTETIETRNAVVNDDVFGIVKKHLVNRIIKLSGTPSPMIRDLAVLFPHAVSGIGASIISASAIEVHTKAGTKIVYGRGGVTKAPGINLSASGDFFDSAMEITVLGKVGELDTVAGHWKALTSSAFPAGDFDAAKIKRYRYVAEFGADPYDAITAQSGFKVSVDYATQEVLDDNVGVGDIALSSIMVMCKCTPSNLTEAQINALVRLDGTGALQPGDDLTTGDDLVVTGGVEGDGFTFTMTNAAAVDAGFAYKTGVLRAGEIGFHNGLDFTSGVAAMPYTFEIL